MTMVCTSFDSEQELLDKYDDSLIILNGLRSFPNVTIEHGVNAWELQKHFQTKFDFVIWCHPHLGQEDFRLHQFLMAHFFHSAVSVLKDNGSIKLALVQGQEVRWNVFKQAKRSGLEIQEIEIFTESLFEGYVVKRNTRGGSFKNIKTKKHVRTGMQSCVFTFSRQPPKYSELEILNRLESFYGENFNSLYSMKQSDSIIADLTPSKKAKRKIVPADLKCTWCFKQMASDRSYNQHVHQVHILKLYGDWTPDRKRIVDCHCGKSFMDESDLWQHNINKHSEVIVDDVVVDTNDYDYVPCVVCGQAVIKGKDGQEVHLESLKPLLGLKMACSICANTFLEQRALLQHFKFCRLRISSA